MKIMEVFANLSREEVALACNQFHGRLEKVIAANGYLLNKFILYY